MEVFLRTGGAEREDSEVPLPEGVIPSLEGILSRNLSEIRPELEQFPVVEASLVYLSPAGIQSLNAQYRDQNRPTDVLSFPLWEEEGRFVPPLKVCQELVLGDIVVCPEVVRAQALEAGESPVRENLLVVIHGFLHLLGFDHADEDERILMWEVQERILAQVLKTLSRDRGDDL